MFYTNASVEKITPRGRAAIGSSKRAYADHAVAPRSDCGGGVRSVRVADVTPYRARRPLLGVKRTLQADPLRTSVSSQTGRHQRPNLN